MGRKTVSVKSIVDKGNKMLAGWTATSEARAGIQRMLEEILHESGNYRGFNYLSETELSEEAHSCAAYYKNQKGIDIDMRPGIRYGAGDKRYVNGVDTWFDNCDTSRVYYYPPEA
jgi:hypothetical protein